MFREDISNEYIVQQSGISEGTQIKYKKGNYWYKKDSRGNEGLSEYLVSKFLTFTDLNPSEYVIYEQGKINDVNGCRSENFLKEDEEMITFYRLYYNEFGLNMADKLGKMETVDERIEYTINFIKESCGLDITDYLRKTIMLDMLVLNEDRHLNNLAVVLKKDHFIPAPIFDNGVSLLTANQSVNWNFPLEENIKRVTARPFSGSHRKMYDYFGKAFLVDVEAVKDWLIKEPCSRERDVLLYQIDRYVAEKII